MICTEMTNKEIYTLINQLRKEKKRRKAAGLWPAIREASADYNRQKSIQHNNTSGHSGVTFNKSASKWQAKIGAGAGKTKHLGYFKTIEDAIAARKLAESKFWHN